MHWMKFLECYVADVTEILVSYPDGTEKTLRGHIRIVPPHLHMKQTGYFCVQHHYLGQWGIVGIATNLGQAQVIAENPWSWDTVYDMEIFLPDDYRDARWKQGLVGKDYTEADSSLGRE